MITALRTDIGKIRQVNEDRCVLIPGLNGYTLAVVADGMGGHQAGDTASQLTIETIQAELTETVHADMDEEELKEAIRSAILRANDAVFQAASEKEHYHGMGTTVVVALADEQRIFLGHIGDSRAYLIGDEGIKQLTEDHTLVNELLKNGQISKEEAHMHPRRNVLTRALGTEQHVDVDSTELPWKPQDQLLLCTDGLTNQVGEEQMLAILQSGSSAEEKVEQLVVHALEAGGDDNITVVLLQHSQSEETKSITDEEAR
ncbi:Stp1/IreP family PP2C-type Ser/Thr phosphatase [Paenibacillus turpanensis]|uniref:Stp1/IreP family PP2C-type Ser/Thr phosphatase n=1 Tax=Paenibacillus turpanensis TaxID=2689078 RepID=UPI0014093274|nr:Stp1/IreP family PP2C-type Ser/Thr phosphatase [Paenibacillus turpanensis]